MMANDLLDIMRDTALAVIEVPAKE